MIASAVGVQLGVHEQRAAARTRGTAIITVCNYSESSWFPDACNEKESKLRLDSQLKRSVAEQTYPPIDLYCV